MGGHEGEAGYATQTQAEGIQAELEKESSCSQQKEYTTPLRGGVSEGSKGERTAKEEEEVCPICLETFGGPLEDFCTPCGHTFHHTCITRILASRTADGKHRCPTCRAQLLVAESHGDPACTSTDGQGVQQSIVLASQPHQSSPLEVFLEWGAPAGIAPPESSRKKWRVRKGLKSLCGRLLNGLAPSL
uniref:RING-type domain-containing protein n=1 Tax=Hemiselmis andersenii TaxID=464988 RepID=A0A6U2AUB7_HEMAN|mmetsp:Transcript_13120/g.30469  ORF Transcript_13120/g.30469 Transcript_13120/m.30469 type:complete len:188 (+) Transcript_13120:212-775(+)